MHYRCVIFSTSIKKHKQELERMMMEPLKSNLETNSATQSFFDGLIDVLLQSYESYAMK